MTNQAPKTDATLEWPNQISGEGRTAQRVELAEGAYKETQPMVSIIITSLNGGEFLPACLDGVLTQIYKNTEVILVDNGSTDGSGEMVKQKYPSVSVMRTEQNLGFTGGANWGASESRGEYLLFLNNDIIITPSFIEELVKAMLQEPRSAVAQSKLLQASNPALLDSVGHAFTPTGFLLHEDEGLPDSIVGQPPKDIFTAKGASMMVRRSIFEELGGFDTDFSIYFEDADLCWRAWLRGHKVLLVPKSVVYHLGGGTTLRLNSHEIVFHNFKNRICSMLKNLAYRDIVRVMPLHIAICIAGSVAWLARSKGRSALAVIRALAWNAIRIPQTMRKRHEITKGLAIGRHELLARFERGMSISTFLLSSRSYLKRW